MDDFQPITRVETYLAALSGEDVTPPEPTTRIEEWLDKVVDNVDNVQTEKVTTAVDAWLSEHIDPETGYVLDDTLTLDNAAAPADKVGELKSALNDLTVEETSHSKQLLNTATGVQGAVVDGGSVSPDGAWANYKTSDYIPVEAGTTYTFYLIKSDGTQPSASYRLIYGLYNSDKTFITGSLFNTDYLNNTVVTPSENGFIRVSCGDISSMQFAFSQMAMFVEGETIYPYEQYYYEITTKLADTIHLNTTQEEDAAAATVDAITDEVQQHDSIQITPQWTSGYCNKSGQITTPYADYMFTQIIAVSEADIIKIYDFTRGAECNFRFVTAYASGIAVSASGQEGGYAFTVPAGIDEIRITVSSVYDEENCVIYRNGMFDRQVIKPEYLPPIGNILAGKKWAACGDSFTAYTNAVLESGEYSGNMRTYPFLIATRNRMDLLSDFAASGRTLAYPADGSFTNSLTCPTSAGYYQNIPEDIDYITIMLGINDCQHVGSGSTGDGEDATGVITLGTINDNTPATYYGAWNTVLGWLRENRPFAHVGIIISNGIQVQQWVEAIEEVAKKWGYPSLNLNGDSRCPCMIRAYNPDVPEAVKTMIDQAQAVDYDGSATGSVNTHPNWQTHEYESAFIEEWLKTI